MHHKRNNMKKKQNKTKQKRTTFVVNLRDPHITTKKKTSLENIYLSYSQEKITGFLSRNCPSSKNHLVYLC